MDDMNDEYDAGVVNFLENVDFPYFPGKTNFEILLL